MMTRTIWWAALAAIVLTAVAGVGLVGTGQAAAPVTMIKVTLKEFSFTPKTPTVAAGPARFVLTNAGTIEHDFVIDALKVDSGMIKPGATVTVPAAGKPPLTLKKGTAYQANCLVPGHKELGMVMTITVK